MLKKTCAPNASDKALLYEIKERVIKIELEQISVASNLAEAKVLLKERERKYDILQEQWEQKLKSHEEKNESEQKDVLIAMAKYDNYFTLRNEIKNWMILTLTAACGSMLTYILLK